MPDFSPITSWEYSHVQASEDGGFGWKEALDKLGREGWELVTTRFGEDNDVSLVLKRPSVEISTSRPTDQVIERAKDDDLEALIAPSPDDSSELGGIRVRRYYGVTQAILASIADGRLREGDRLPNERSLATTCGASRPTVRDALLALELIGVIEIRPGSGAYVTRSSPHPGTLMSINFEAPPRELIEAREEIEPAVARLCAGRVTAADLERLGQLIDEGEQEAKQSPPDAPESFLKLSLQFHSELAALCGNEILAKLTQQLVDVTAHPLWMVVNGIHLRSMEARTIQIAEHRAVLRAIANRQVDQAGTVMSDHLRSLSHSVFGQGTVAAQRWKRHES